MLIYIVPLAFIGFDVLTGLLKAFKNHNVSSGVLHEGLYHKIAEVIVLVGAAMCESALKYLPFNLEIPLYNAVASYICIMEFVSISENLGEINPDLVKLFKPYLIKINQNQQKGGKGNDGEDRD